jgi:hypothetical protein
MKAVLKPLISVFLGLCVSMGCAGLLQAQTQIGETNVTWQGTISLVTVSNITYAEYTWVLYGCDCESVDSLGPLVQNSNSFSYNFDLEMETGPVACPQFIARITTPAALGQLAPGNYTLITTSWGAPVATNNFTISTNSQFSPPILCPMGFGTNGWFQIRMSNCDSNTSYVLQCSTNLVNWIPLSTNSGGPPFIDPSVVSPGQRFYRVRILQH